MQEEEIKSRIAEIADFKNLKEVELEILNLPRYLSKDETIEGIAKCILDMNDWLILVTNKRVLLSNYILCNQIIDIPKASIQNIYLNGGSLYSELVIERGKGIIYLKILTNVSTEIYHAIKCVLNGEKIERIEAKQEIIQRSDIDKIIKILLYGSLIMFGLYYII